ncbi:MAG TPA: ABC transporter ATP-binding protein [Rhodanobacteraceae bacterium]|nr:ABC transporter ATP-binding protein [Rhodanobacteraceae bacterium]
MSPEDFSIRVEGLSKRYEIYAQPVDRLKQMVLPRAQRAMQRPARAWFKEFWALRDVSFDVRKGETVGIVGRNGSGKSTLLQMICGTLNPTLGKVAVNGRVAALLELGAGFNPEFTGKENIRLSGLLYGLSEQELNARYDAILDFAEIGDFVDRPVKTYSSGMYVRLAFSVAINVSPDVLVVDEALSVGDEAFQRKCFARIDAIRDAGATVLFVSHAAGTVIELCNRTILLDQGEMVADGAPRFVVPRYHKLLYSPAGKTVAVREAIKQESLASKGGKGSSVMDPEDRPDASRGEIPSQVNGVEIREVEESAYFDEAMTPRSTVHYQSRGALITAPRIETDMGRQVNVLSPGREYIYTYDVLFQTTAVGVRLGMMIKTITGLELGGATTAPNHVSGLIVSAAQRLQARFRFRAMLAPGVYFMNAGVTAIEPEGETYMDRIVDVLMFRVTHDSDRMATGTVDFHVLPHLSVESVS